MVTFDAGDLLDNAWKFTSQRPKAHIEVGVISVTFFFTLGQGTYA
jgi:hypothetical protein